MKSFFSSAFLPALLCGFALTQNPNTVPASNPAPQARPNTAQAVPEASQQANATPRIAPGSVIPVQLVKSIDAKKVKTGDEVDAKVTKDLKAANGQIVVPKDTRVVGRVTEVQAHSKEQKESQVGLAFDHAVMKNGGDVALPMSVQAIISSSYLSSSNGSDANSAPAAAPSSNGAMSPGNNSSRSPGVGSQPATPTPDSSSGGLADNSEAANTRRPITGETQGVLGFPNLKLSSATQGSVVSSEKNNVKLDSGTLMLLRVNQ